MGSDLGRFGDSTLNGSFRNTSTREPENPKQMPAEMENPVTWPFAFTDPMKRVSTAFRQSLVLLFLMLTSKLPAQASEPPCVPDELLELNGVVYLGPAEKIIEKLGKPLQVKTHQQDSPGNSGSRLMKTYVYRGAKIIAPDGPSQEVLVEGWVLSSPDHVMGKKLHVGMSKKDAARLLKIRSDSEVPSVAEAQKMYEGKKPKLSSKKSSWSLSSCSLSPETSFIELHFSPSQKLSKIIVLHDDSAI